MPWNQEIKHNLLAILSQTESQSRDRSSFIKVDKTPNFHFRLTWVASSDPKSAIIFVSIEFDDLDKFRLIVVLDQAYLVSLSLPDEILNFVISSSSRLMVSFLMTYLFTLRYYCLSRYILFEWAFILFLRCDVTFQNKLMLRYISNLFKTRALRIGS